MKLPRTVRHAFVDLMPPERENGVVYVSMKHATAVHNCLCGCGMKVVTPIRPDKWVLTFNGEAISLSPSIGNWSFPCKSHYWIESGRVLESGRMSDEAIASGRKRDAMLTTLYHGQGSLQMETQAPEAVSQPAEKLRRKPWWARWLGR